MSVVVKGMKMPDSCAVCRFAGKGGYHMERVVCMFTGKNEDAKNIDRLPDCPLVALPDKHGDLIDRSDLVKSLGITDMDCDKCEWRLNQWGQCKRGGDFSDACFAIEMAETIVEAEDNS
jgi:hypothetical protein